MNSPLQFFEIAFRTFMEGGPMMWPILFILGVILCLAVFTAIELFLRGGNNRSLVQNGLDGLLFWGIIAVVFGVLGQVVGHYKCFSAMAAHGLASPRVAWIGAAECLTSTIAGLAVFTVAGILWFLLRGRFHGRVAMPR